MMAKQNASLGTSERMPRLQSAKFEPVETEVSYKSGAHFKGQVQDHKKMGRGIFTWPNGARYEGDYVDNVRTGKGYQLWPDGSQYVGDFMQDMRHGKGKHTWANGESCQGDFFRDRRHGRCLYMWFDGSTFEGTFYMDRKEGFGVFRFANGNIFEGLYKEDEREGPGIMTYTDNRQDVGLWHGEKLVKICSPVNDAFSLKDHKEFEYNPKEHTMYINGDEECNSRNVDDVTSESGIFDCDSDTKVTEKVTEIFNVSLDPRSLAVNKEAFEKAFFGETLSEGDKDEKEKVVAWNKTPSMIQMQKHFHKHRYSRKTISFSIEDILNGNRSGFKDKGPLELASEELIQAATLGKINRVEDLLTSGKVSPDVADKNGHTALIGATVNWHTNVINSLLNHGADVNKLSDEGCSALSAGSIFYYPIESFRYNIAERYLTKPKQSKAPQQINKSSQPPKGILSKTKQIGGRKTIQNVPQSKSKSGTEIGENLKNKLSDQQAENSSSLDSDVNPANNKHSNPKQQVKINANSESEQIQDQEKDSGLDLQDNLPPGKTDKEEEFESNLSLKYFMIEVSENLIERCATQLSTNEKVVGGQRAKDSADLGRVRHLAVIKSEQEKMKNTLDLLLKRGADPNASGVPMPILFFAIKAADVEMVKTLLIKGASTAITLQKEKGSLAPLHIACAIPGEEGVQITELLLNALANPDVRATPDDSFLNTMLQEEWSKDVISKESQELLGGRTPLHIACARDDDYKNACRVVKLLLEHRANPDLLCNGFSPLALAIVSGNDLAIDELLSFGANPSLPLTHGVGSALCASANTEYEHRRTLQGRLQLIDKLIRAGGNILAPIPIGPKRIMGTAVDYAYYIYNLDRRIAYMPYHALTHDERETYNARRKLLAHMGDILRTKAVEREKKRHENERSEGRRSASNSANFVYIGAGAPLPPDARKPKFLREKEIAEGHLVTFESALVPAMVSGDSPKLATELEDVVTLPPRKPLFKYCYECGRSVGVKLTACTRCKEVYYCSKACKLKAWKTRHQEECIRVGGHSRSPSPTGRKARADSPTPATYPDKDKKLTVSDLTKDKRGLRINVPFKGRSQSAKGPKGQDYSDDTRRVRSDFKPTPWNPAPGVYIDNYSFN
ncbi:hypothetical protein ACJMK2_019046 [Sinanodonta woodiana]|uniref:MYND-type domain-containing protein n=1 Tax=Sinanodonta woodiana TaxID=1069815 RepID=A0ABD3UGL3_SINWO